ncbi:hypothetical protein [Lacticaseibacillus sp. GG6-2]
MFQFLTYPMFVAENPDDAKHRFTFTSPDFTDLCVQGATIVDTAHKSGAQIAHMIDAGVPAPQPGTVPTDGRRVAYVSVDRRG